MKRYKLEFSLAAIFVVFIILLLWQSLYLVNNVLPIILTAVCILFLVALLIPQKAKNKEDQHQEAYAPRYFAQAIISSIVGIAVIVSAAVVLNKDNFSKNIDFTKNKINSLSDESVKFLNSLNKPVQIFCVPSPSPIDNYCEDSRELVNLYARNSKNIIVGGKLNLADKNKIQLVQPSGFSRLVVITNDNKSEIDGKITESKLTNSLINLIKFKKAVYFLSGSGEPSLNVSEGERNYSDIASALQAKAYEVKDWNIKQGPLPSDARVLVAGDNLITYSNEVESIITKFVNQGGKLILIANPYRELGLQKFLESVHIKLQDILLTLNTKSPIGSQFAEQHFTRPPLIVSNFSVSSPITKVIMQVYGPQAVIFTDGGRPIEILKDQSTGFKTQATVLMSAFAAAPITLTEQQRNKIDLRKPFSLSVDKNFDANKSWPVAVDVTLNDEKSKNKSEIVVFGVSIMNIFSKQNPITEELIPLTIAHLYQDQELVSIPPRDMGPKQFNTTRNPGAWLPLFSGILPIMTALIGFFIWMRRRSA